MEEQPEALRLANALTVDNFGPLTNEAAAELRRLHAENQALRQALEQSVVRIDTSAERVDFEAAIKHIPAPPECQTEAEKTAVAFGWYKALESVREQSLPFGVGGGLAAIKTLLSRDPCAHANVAIKMIDAMLTEQPAPAQDDRNKLAAWMMQRGFATGHGDTMDELLDELGIEIAELKGNT
jgi:hypothetical protein